MKWRGGMRSRASGFARPWNLNQAHKKGTKEKGCRGVISKRKFPDMPRRIAQERLPTMPEVAPDHTIAGCPFGDLYPFCSFLD